MELPHVYVLLLAAAATALLALGKVPLGVVGIGMLVGVLAPGLITAQQAVAGFGNKAVVTVGALYVVGEGFHRTGAATQLAGRILSHTGGNETRVTLSIVALAAAMSAFVNNILVVVTFLPVVTSICRETGIYPSRLLIPLSYASIAGGLTTLVGTSTNLLVSGVLEEFGRPPLGMFEMTGPGLVLAGAAIVYVTLLGRRLLPSIPSLATQQGADEIREYVTEITVAAQSPLIGQPIAAVGTDPENPSSRVQMAVREELPIPREDFATERVQAGDLLVLRGRVQDLASLHRDHKQVDTTAGAADGAEQTERYDPSSMSFFELAISPDSSLVGKRLRELRVKERYGAVVVGLLRAGRHLQTRLHERRIGQGDLLLVFGNDHARETLRRSTDFAVIEGVDRKLYRDDKSAMAFAVILGLVTMFVSGVEPVTAALIGALAMVLTGCVTARQAHLAVNWPILIFIAGTIALSRALSSTGADQLIGGFLAGALADAGPWVLLGVMYLGTIALTELLSNNAVAVLMVPVALATADAAGVDERLLCVAVALAASNSFANPIGYKTNLLVFGPGGYRFRDFIRVGIGLDLLMAAVGIAVLPWFFPF